MGYLYDYSLGRATHFLRTALILHSFASNSMSFFVARQRSQIRFSEEGQHLTTALDGGMRTRQANEPVLRLPEIDRSIGLLDGSRRDDYR